MATDYFIRKLTLADKEAYAAFTTSHPSSLLYQSLPYIELIAELTGGEQQTMLAFDAMENLCGVLPLLSKTASLGTVYNSLPYYGSNGGVLGLSAEVEQALHKAYNRLATSSQVAAATWVHNPLLPIPDETAIAHNVTDFRIGQFTPIAYDSDHDDKLMHSFHYKTRNMIRKAMKSGFSVSEENDNVGFVEEVHRENMKAIGGRAKSSEFFTGFRKAFSAGDDFRIWMARHENKPVAALLLFYFRDTVEYYLPVTREAYRDRQPLSLLIFEAMKEASSRGFKLWNWGGTWASQEGVHRFKKRWGTEDRNYTYFVQVNNQEIFSASRADLLEQYRDFFVLPFQHLTTNP